MLFVQSAALPSCFSPSASRVRLDWERRWRAIEGRENGVDSYRVAPYSKLRRMTHTIREKQKLLARVRRIRGQVDAIERALETEADCEKMMHLLASTRAAMSGLMCEVIEGHVLTHLVDQERYPGALDNDGAEQLLAVVRTYLK